MATHSSILAWKTPWTEEPGGPGVKNLPSNVVDSRVILGQGTKIPLSPGQLSLGVLQLEKAHMRQKRPSRAKRKKSKMSFFCTKAKPILFWLESLY